MSYTMQDFRLDFVKEHLHLLTIEERLAGLTLEERLAGLSLEQIEHLLEFLKTRRAQGKLYSRGRR